MAKALSYDENGDLRAEILQVQQDILQKANVRWVREQHNVMNRINQSLVENLNTETAVGKSK
ncbi:hypothetical protein D3C83_193250 [compost metagenome]